MDAPRFRANIRMFHLSSVAGIEGIEPPRRSFGDYCVPIALNACAGFYKPILS